jgi:ATP-dependent DNA helicase RecG
MKLLHELNIPIQYLKGIGEVRAKKFKYLGINTVYELLTYYPRTYQDRTKIKPIALLQHGEIGIFSGVIIHHVNASFYRKGVNFIKVCVSDGTGYAYLLFFKQTNITKILPIGTKIFVTGRIRRYRNEIQVTDFEYELIDDKEDKGLVHGNRIVPIYPLTEKVSGVMAQKMLRQAINQALNTYLPRIKDILPADILLRQQLMDLPYALYNIHFPENEKKYKEARKRLVFDEFFLLQLAFGIIKRETKIIEQGIRYVIYGKLMNSFINLLPFSLTNAQKRVIQEIANDMAMSRPMNRLVHGDVGSGKTVVATCAAIIACENGYQTAFMAPTEILAEQHFLTLQHLLSSLDADIKLGILTSSIRKQERDKLLSMVEDGEIDILIGTHALIQRDVVFHKLGLCIIDEQHRFGVVQRSALKEKAKFTTPDILVMTATPIPRTLALTLYGDLDISVIDELPPNRQKVITKCRSEESMDKIYSFIRQEISFGRQAYIIYPLIEESEELELKSAVQMFDELKKIFSELKLGLLHGQMKVQEKDNVMNAFYNQEIDILVSTTVIEVGIDVPNATIMLIEHAERFGLAQLHQLRGRIGRGKYKSYCILMASKDIADIVNSNIPIDIKSDPNSTILKSAKRLRTMCETNDGFKIAEVDLEIRGPGEFFGTKQHGMPELKLAHIIRDVHLLEAARKEAFQLLDNDPTLNEKEHQGIKELFLHEFQEKLKFGSVG